MTNTNILSVCILQAGALKNFIPLFDRVLVQRLAAETKTKGGVLIPEKSQAKVLEATVVAVGPGRVSEVSLELFLVQNYFNCSLSLLFTVLVIIFLHRKNLSKHQFIRHLIPTGPDISFWTSLRTYGMVDDVT